MANRLPDDWSSKPERRHGRQEMTMVNEIEKLSREIEALRAVEHLLATNEGTYGSAEARRKVGCGDPQFADRRVYETVGGARRETGPAEDRAPGHMRHVGRQALAADRSRLALLEQQRRDLAPPLTG
jgi:hypothetical protein